MRHAAIVLALTVAASAAHAQYKCVSPTRAVSLQQTPCPPEARSERLRVLAPARGWSAARVRVGMTLGEVFESAGRAPDRENTSETAAGSRRQMMFEDAHHTVYVYTLNDVVTATQSIRR